MLRVPSARRHTPRPAVLLAAGLAACTALALGGCVSSNSPTGQKDVSITGPINSEGATPTSSETESETSTRSPTLQPTGTETGTETETETETERKVELLNRREPKRSIQHLVSRDTRVVVVGANVHGQL